MPIKKSALTAMQSTSAPASVYCIRQALTGLTANAQGCPLSLQHASRLTPATSRPQTEQREGELDRWGGRLGLL